jgi:hypothetical protein
MWHRTVSDAAIGRVVNGQMYRHGLRCSEAVVRQAESMTADNLHIGFVICNLNARLVADHSGLRLQAEPPIFLMRFGSNLLRPNPRPSPIAANNAGSYMRRDLIPNVAGIPSSVL